MNLKEIGLSTSSFGYAMGNTGKGTDRANPTPWTLEDFLGFAIDHSFGGIEAPLMRFVPDLDATRIERLRSTLAEHGMFFIMDAEAALDAGQIRALIPHANALGSPIIRIKSSDILGCARGELGKPWSTHVQRCIEVLTELAPELRAAGLKIAVENHQDLDSSDLMQIIEAVGSDVVGVNFDIGNAFATCEDPVAFAHKLAPYILNVHLKEYRIYECAEGYRLARCPIGEGSVDFATILPFLAREAPGAKFVIEQGALSARTIACRVPGFWDHIQPRPEGEREAFSALLAREAIVGAGDAYQTPWEQGGSGEAVTSYEVDELESSITYLATTL